MTTITDWQMPHEGCMNLRKSDKVSHNETSVLHVAVGTVYNQRRELILETKLHYAYMYMYMYNVHAFSNLN